MIVVSTLKSTFDIVVPSCGQRMGPYSSGCSSVSPSTLLYSTSPVAVGSTSRFSSPCWRYIPRQVGQVAADTSPNDIICSSAPSRGQFIASSSRRPLHRQLQHHRRPHALDRGDGDLAAVGLHDLLHDVEPEARAAAAAQRLASALLVLLPDLRQLARLHTNASVRHRDDDRVRKIFVG